MESDKTKADQYIEPYVGQGRRKKNSRVLILTESLPWILWNHANKVGMNNCLCRERKTYSPLLSRLSTLQCIENPKFMILHTEGCINLLCDATIRSTLNGKSKYWRSWTVKTSATRECSRPITFAFALYAFVLNWDRPRDGAAVNVPFT